MGFTFKQTIYWCTLNMVNTMPRGRAKNIITKDFILSRAVVDSDTGCLEWTGTLDKKGYGVVNGITPSGTYKTTAFAHRMMYEAEHGEIQTGQCIRHTCDNPRCINPTHLQTGTLAENNHDRVSRGRSANKRGEATNFAVLTWETVREIRKRYGSEKISQSQLGREFGVNYATIHYIVKNKTWVE